jgi:hypothetical protein
MLYGVHLTWVGFELTSLVVIGSDCICSYKSNYYAIKNTTAPRQTEVLLKVALNSIAPYKKLNCTISHSKWI